MRELGPKAFALLALCFGAAATSLGQSPATPTSLVAAPISSTTITLSWQGQPNDSGRGVSYKVYWSPDGTTGWTQVGTNSVPTLNVAGHSAETTYHFRVSAVANSQTSSYSDVVSCRTLMVAPTNVKGYPGDGQSRLTWSSLANATSYVVRRALKTSQGTSAFATVGTVSALEFKDAGLTNGQQYVYVVSGANSGGGEENTPGVTIKPAAPKLSSISATPSSVVMGGTREMKVALSSFVGSSLVNVLISSGDPTVTTPASVTVPSGSTTATFLVSANEVVEPKVVEVSGVLSTATAKCSLFVTPLQPPTNPIAIRTVTSPAVNVSWDPVNGASGYKVEVNTATPAVWRLVTTLTGDSTSLQAGNLNGVAACFRIRSTAGSYVSSPSSIAAIEAGVGNGSTDSLPVGAPSMLEGESDNGAIKLSWGRAPRAVQYTVYRSNTANSGFAYKSKPSNNFYMDATCIAGNLYYYKVVATGANGVIGGESNVIGVVCEMTDGHAPRSELVVASNGIVYGSTSMGGPSNTGTVFAIDSSGVYRTLTGAAPMGADGTNVGGATIVGTPASSVSGLMTWIIKEGGTWGDGGTFRMSTNGATSTGLDLGVLGIVGDGAEGYYAITSRGGGAFDRGMLLKISGANTTTLYSLPIDNLIGSEPAEGLTMGPGGNLFAMTTKGGANAAGTILKWSPSGVCEVLFDFPAADEVSNPYGVEPSGRLSVASDGTVTGVSRSGGENDAGFVFRLANGQYSILRTFDAVEDDDTNETGIAPVGGLVAMADGSLIGVCSEGGEYGHGTIFKLSSTGVFSILHAFNGDDGSDPLAGLTMGQNGVLYGTASSGGAFGGGTLFSLIPGSPIQVLHHFRSNK